MKMISLVIVLSACVAADQAQAQMSCSQVRGYVTQYGLETVVSMARQQGISGHDIKKALACLREKRRQR